MKKARIEIWDAAYGYKFSLDSEDGKMIMISQNSYKTKSSAKRVALRAKRLMAEAGIEEGK